MNPQPVLLERHGTVVVLRLNTPENRNALSPKLQSALNKHLDQLESDTDVRVLVLTGNGRVFSSGADLLHLDAMLKNSTEENQADAAQLAHLIQRIYHFPKPVIAALEGAAVAGGAGLATACDLIVAGESCKIGYTEVRLGFVAAIVGVLLLRCIGEKHARELLLTGKMTSALEAQRMGLINRVVDDGQALQTSLALAAQVAQNSPSALRASKALLAVLPELDLPSAWQHAVEVNVQLRSTEDFKEGVQAFFEKRQPQWRK